MGQVLIVLVLVDIVADFYTHHDTNDGKDDEYEDEADPAFTSCGTRGLHSKVHLLNPEDVMSNIEHVKMGSEHTLFVCHHPLQSLSSQ